MRSILIKIFLPVCIFCYTNAFALSSNKHLKELESSHSINYLPNTNADLKDSIESTLRGIKSKNAWVSVIDIQRSFDSSFGMMKMISGTSYEIAFKKIDFTKTTATARVFAKVTIPQMNTLGIKKALYFQGFITITRRGGLISDGKLKMIGNDTIVQNNNWALVVNGYTDGASNNPSTPTYFEMDCNGYKQLSINGSVVLSTENFKPVNTLSSLTTTSNAVTGNFSKIISIWDSLYVTNISFNKPFTPKYIPHYIFEIKSAIFDFNDNRNPNNNADITNRINDQVSDIPNTWKGLSITNVEISLPEWFKNKNSSDRVKVSSNYAAIDENGFATKVKASNILNINNGSARGWPFSVDSLAFIVDDSVITQGRFNGKIILPIVDRVSSDAAVEYIGSITDSTYTAVIGKNGFGNIKAEIWKSYLKLDPSSSFSMTVKNNEFYPKSVLNGMLAFANNANKVELIQTPEEAKKNNKPSFFSMDSTTFQELTFQTERPFIKATAFSAGGALKISGFEASVSASYDRTARPSGALDVLDYAGINFHGTIGFMDGKFSGGLDVNIFGVYDSSESKWTYHSTALNSIALAADFGKMGFKGAVDFFKEDSVYGNGFSGSGSLKFLDHEIGASLILGKYYDDEDRSKNFQYWSADAYVTGLNINIDGIIIDGFSGGASYHMEPTETPNPKFLSGVAYVPTSDIFLRLRAGLFINVISKNTFSGWAGIEIAFNSNYGLSSISLSGVGQLMSASGVDQNSTKIKPASKSRGRRNAILVTDPDPVKSPEGARLMRQDAETALNRFNTLNPLNRADGVLNMNTATQDPLNRSGGQRNLNTDDGSNNNNSAAADNLRNDVQGNIATNRAIQKIKEDNIRRKLSQTTQPYVDQPNGTFMWGDFSAVLDVDNKKFTFEMDVYANYQNIIEGAGENDKLGSIDMLISKDAWHIYVGTKESPNGLRLNLGYLASASSTSYFEMGNDINSHANADFAILAGIQISYKASFDISVVKAEASASINFETYLQHKNNFTCNGSTAGFYGWYGAAQLGASFGIKAYLHIPEVNLYLFTIPKYDYKFFEGSLDADVAIRGPNPFYANGRVTLHYDALGFKGEVSGNFETGTYCNF